MGGILEMTKKIEEQDFQSVHEQMVQVCVGSPSISTHFPELYELCSVFESIVMIAPYGNS